MDDDTLRFYRHNAEAYAQREITSRQARLTRFLARLPRGAAILELGCGAGGDSAEMLALGFDVHPTDPIALATAAVLFGLIALGACLLPAWRAGRVDLMEALRQE